MRQHFLRSNHRDQGEPEEFIPDSEGEDYDDIGESGMQSENMCGPSGAEAGIDEDPSSDFFYDDDDEDTDPNESDTDFDDSENETHEDDYDSSSNYNGHQDDDDSDSAVNDAGEYAFEADDKDGSPGGGSGPKTPPGTMDPNNYGATASNTSILSEGTPEVNADFMNDVSTKEAYL